MILFVSRFGIDGDDFHSWDVEDLFLSEIKSVDVVMMDLT